MSMSWGDRVHIGLFQTKIQLHPIPNRTYKNIVCYAFSPLKNYLKILPLRRRDVVDERGLYPASLRRGLRTSLCYVHMLRILRHKWYLQDVTYSWYVVTWLRCSSIINMHSCMPTPISWELKRVEVPYSGDRPSQHLFYSLLLIPLLL